HRRDLRPMALGPVFALRRAHNGGHVRAPTGDQDHDVLHVERNYPRGATMVPLTAAEARVLGTLMEKARTVPDSYPMTLNSVVAGCNQKSSRDPITNLSDAEVQEALDGLKRRSLAFTTRGGRTDR